MRTTTEVLHDHLARRLEGDAEGDVQRNYAEHVVMLTGSGIYRGRDGVRQCDGADSFVVHDGLIVLQTVHYTPQALRQSP